MTYPIGFLRDQKVNSRVRLEEEKGCQAPTRGMHGAPLIREIKPSQDVPRTEKVFIGHQWNL